MLGFKSNLSLARRVGRSLITQTEQSAPEAQTAAREGLTAKEEWR